MNPSASTDEKARDEISRLVADHSGLRAKVDAHITADAAAFDRVDLAVERISVSVSELRDSVKADFQRMSDRMLMLQVTVLFPTIGAVIGGLVYFVVPHILIK